MSDTQSSTTPINHLLAEARLIARGDTLALPTLEHLKALDDYSLLLERTIQMAMLGARKEMGDLERWAEAQSRQKANA